MEKGWIEVFITAHEYKASMAKDLLENEGVKAVVLNQHDSAYQTFGEFSVHVAEKDVEKASELLKNLKH
jgi:predicted Fe-Mo cluster-binding NifX family protein